MGDQLCDGASDKDGELLGEEVGSWLKDGGLLGEEVGSWLKDGGLLGEDVGPWLKDGGLLGEDVGCRLEDGPLVGVCEEILLLGDVEESRERIFELGDADGAETGASVLGRAVG